MNETDNAPEILIAKEFLQMLEEIWLIQRESIKKLSTIMERLQTGSNLPLTGFVAQADCLSEELFSSYRRKILRISNDLKRKRELESQ